MKLLKMFTMAGLAVFLGAGAAFAAGPYGDPCPLIDGLRQVFDTIRRLAFAGAAFVLAGWAWTFITQGWGKSGDKGEGGTDLNAAKNKGVGMLIGFVLLFGLGMIMRFLPGAANCNMNW
jgi:uncharacterized RDD family membrane protein YckC